MFPSIWTECFAEYEPEKAIEIISSCGFRCVEFGGTRHLEAIDRDPDPRLRTEKLRNLAKRVGVRIDQMHGPFVNPCEETNLNTCKEFVCRSLEYASILGVKWMVLHPGTAPEEMPHMSEERIIELNLEFFGQLLPSAREANVGIAIENLFAYPHSKSRTYGSRVEDLLHLVEKLNDESVGICWDTGHANLQGLEQPSVLYRIAGHTKAVHIADNDRTDDQHSIPFSGRAYNHNTCDWEGIVESLKGIQFTGPFNLEIPGATNKIPLPLRPRFIEYAYCLCEYLCTHPQR